MIVSEEKQIAMDPMPFEIVWRNPLAVVQAQLRDKEVSDRYHRWAEQARKIRARRVS